MAVRVISFHYSLYSALEKLLEMTGSSLNVATDNGVTALHIAAINGYREIAEILLEQVITRAYNSCICLSQRIRKRSSYIYNTSSKILEVFFFFNDYILTDSHFVYHPWGDKARRWVT